MASSSEPGDADRRHMARALELAEAGWGRVHPNPLVGAVVVRGGEVVGEGAHREFGGPHAEVEALAVAGDLARGATLYVTLEPCDHHGKTPPCTAAILEHGITRVVYGAADPHAEASGGGAHLRSQGVDVVAGVEAERCRRQNIAFLTPIEDERPYVALKFGLTLDGRIARTGGQRTAITGPEALREAHRLRAGHDAILVGARTARVDDPLLTIRDAPAPRVAPIRIVADPMARMPADGALARTAGESPVWALVGPEAPEDRTHALEQRGVEVVPVPAGPGGLDLEAALDRLMDRGVRTVFCEGGGVLGAGLLAVRRVDRMYLFYAPVVFGSGVAAFPEGAHFEGKTVAARQVGRDTLVIMDRSE